MNFQRDWKGSPEDSRPLGGVCVVPINSNPPTQQVRREKRDFLPPSKKRLT